MLYIIKTNTPASIKIPNIFNGLFFYTIAGLVILHNILFIDV